MSEQYSKSGREVLGYLAKYRDVALKVKGIVRRHYPDAKLYVFGSAVEGNTTATSDIDILIVCDKLDWEEGQKLKAAIRKQIGLSVPIQLHIASGRKLETWYRRFIGQIEEI